MHRLSVPRIRVMLEKVSEAQGGSDLALCCFEDLRRPGQVCHRRMLARWWQERTGDVMPELEEVA